MAVKVWLVATALAFSAVGAAVAQSASSEVQSVTPLGMEHLATEERISALEAEVAQLRDAANILNERSLSTSGRVEELLDRISKGNEPLVAFEIEQLWSVVRALETENSTLRERLAALGGE